MAENRKSSGRSRVDLEELRRVLASEEAQKDLEARLQALRDARKTPAEIERIREAAAQRRFTI